MITALFSLFAATTATCDQTFFGLVPWYHYLGNRIGPPPNCEIKSFNILPTPGNPTEIPLVLAAIVDDLLRIAGIVAVAFVIIGSIQFITSQGNPEDAAKAQNTIINSLIGLAITIVAVAFVSYLGNNIG